MAIGSVLELVDYKKETIKIAKQHGGTKIDLDAIADEYNPERETPYSKGDLVVYNGDLYKASATVPTKAGVFKPEMWVEIPTYDAEETYNQGELVVYSGTVYRCISVDPVTGEWDSAKWYAQTVNSYDVNGSYSAGSLVEYDTKYYGANNNYANDPVGEFNLLYWTPTSIEQLLTESKFKLKYSRVYGSAESMLPLTLTTDADGIVKIDITTLGGYPLAFVSSFMQPMLQFNSEIVKVVRTTAMGSPGTTLLYLKFTDVTTGEALANTEITWYMNSPHIIYVNTEEMENVENSSIRQYVES